MYTSLIFARTKTSVTISTCVLNAAKWEPWGQPHSLERVSEKKSPPKWLGRCLQSVESS